MRRNLRSRLRVIAPVVAMTALLVGAAACNGDAPTTSPVPRTVSADAKEAERRAFDDLVDDEQAYQAAIERSNVRANLLRCALERRQSAAQVIGPQGGRIDVGHHSLTIPAGALQHDTLITATIVSRNASVVVEFAPHGLQFAKPALLEMSYAHCVAAAAGYVNRVVYVDDRSIALEGRPSFDDDGVRTVFAWIDHFSGYAIATRKPE
jgi:hypothetical protein